MEDFRNLRSKIHQHRSLKFEDKILYRSLDLKNHFQALRVTNEYTFYIIFPYSHIIFQYRPMDDEVIRDFSLKRVNA